MTLAEKSDFLALGAKRLRIWSAMVLKFAAAEDAKKGLREMKKLNKFLGDTKHFQARQKWR